MSVNGSSFDKRTEAGAQLQFVLGRELKATARGSTREPIPVGELAGFPLTATVDRRIDHEVRLRLGDAIDVTMSASELSNSDPVGLLQRVERRIGGLEDALAEAQTDLRDATQEAERARARVGRPFEHAGELARLVRRQAELTEAMMPSTDDAAVATLAAQPVSRGSGIGLA